MARDGDLYSAVNDDDMLTQPWLLL